MLAISDFAADASADGSQTAFTLRQKPKKRVLAPIALGWK